MSIDLTVGNLYHHFWRQTDDGGASTSVDYWPREISFDFRENI